MASRCCASSDVQKKLGRQKVLQGVNLEIDQGERMVIIGRSGGGKSVLLKHIIGLMQPDAGQVWFRDQDLATHERGAARAAAQGDRHALPERRAVRFAQRGRERGFSACAKRGMKDEAIIRSEVARALKIVDLPGQESKWPSELSGGMRKRVALARAAIAKPALMLYDEPTSGLDPVVADSINKLMVRLGKELEMTSIIVTHDMVSAKEVGDRIAFLYEGRIYCVDKPEVVLASHRPDRAPVRERHFRRHRCRLLKSTMKQNLETKVGLFLMFGIAVICTLIICFGAVGDLFKPTYTLTLTFPDASGLLKGSEVYLSGAEIGKVTTDPQPIPDSQQRAR